MHEFEDSWQQLLDNYHLLGNPWLSLLYGEREHWIPTYVKDTFWAGMSTTQRSESMNAFFDDYVNSKTSLAQFVEQYDSALRSKVEKESLADFNSFNLVILLSPIILEAAYWRSGPEQRTGPTCGTRAGRAASDSRRLTQARATMGSGHLVLSGALS